MFSIVYCMHYSPANGVSKIKPAEKGRRISVHCATSFFNFPSILFFYRYLDSVMKLKIKWWYVIEKGRGVESCFDLSFT